MGFRMRKSIKVAPGVRVNVSKSGVGASVGGKGGRYSVHSSGRQTVSAGSGIVPGVYYQKSVSGKGSRGGTKSAAAAATQSAPGPPRKPGLFAPKGEKELYKAVGAQDAEAIERVGEAHPDFRLPAYSVAGLLFAKNAPDKAERLLAEAFATGKDPGEDKFIAKYMTTFIGLPIAEGVSTELPLNRDAIGLMLGELRQQQGNLDGAIDVVEQLEPTTYSAVSLAELYAQTERWDEVIESPRA